MNEDTVHWYFFKKKMLKGNLMKRMEKDYKNMPDVVHHWKINADNYLAISSSWWSSPCFMVYVHSIN